MDDRLTHTSRLASQRGISVLETLVALALFALCAATMGDYLVSQIRLSTSNYLTTQAYAIAEQELESTRALDWADMAPGSKVVSVDGRVFNVATAILNDSPADGLKSITINVSWNEPLGAKSVAVKTIYTEVQAN